MIWYVSCRHVIPPVLDARLHLSVWVSASVEVGQRKVQQHRRNTQLFKKEIFFAHTRKLGGNYVCCSRKVLLLYPVLFFAGEGTG